MSNLIQTEQTEILMPETLINDNPQQDLEVAEAESQWLLMSIYYNDDRLY